MIDSILVTSFMTQFDGIELLAATVTYGGQSENYGVVDWLMWVLFYYDTAATQQEVLGPCCGVLENPPTDSNRKFVLINMGAGGWYYVPKVGGMYDGNNSGLCVFGSGLIQYRSVIATVCLTLVFPYLAGLDPLWRMVGWPKTLETQHIHGWSGHWIFFLVSIFRLDRTGTSADCSCRPYPIPKVVQIRQGGRPKSVKKVECRDNAMAGHSGLSMRRIVNRVHARILRRRYLLNSFDIIKFDKNY
jgi:hypothetical protein